MLVQSPQWRLKGAQGNDFRLTGLRDGMHLTILLSRVLGRQPRVCKQMRLQWQSVAQGPSLLARDAAHGGPDAGDGFTGCSCEAERGHLTTARPRQCINSS